MHTFRYDDLVAEGRAVAVRKESYTHDEEVHMHDFVEVVYIISGKGVQCVDDKKCPVGRGDLIFINYHQSHSFQVDEHMSYYNLFLHPTFFTKICEESQHTFDLLALTAFEEFRESVMQNKTFLRFSGNDLLEIERLFEILLREQQEQHDGFKSAMQAYTTVLFVQIFRKMLGTIESVNDTAISIEEITRYVEENCWDKLSLNDLAGKCFFNPSYFSRMFKKKNGMSLKTFIHTSRINRACTLLKETDMTIEKISVTVGYTDKTKFYAQFKKIMDCLPTEYRKKYSASAEFTS